MGHIVVCQYCINVHGIRVLCHVGYACGYCMFCSY